MSVRLISIVGFSGSGKTTLIEALIPRLTAQGLKVATIKNAHHKVTLDTPGKDSWRYKQAGACLSMLVTSDGVQLVADPLEDSAPDRLAQRFLGEADLVLAEGFSATPGPKIEVLRRANNITPRCQPEQGLIAMVTDVDEVYPQLPHFELDALEPIAAFILQQKI